MTTTEHYSRSSESEAYLELDDVARLEESATNLRDRLLIRLLFHLGCRVSEALALDVDYTDFTHGTVTIIHLKTRLKLSRTQCVQRLGKNHTFCPKYGGKIEKTKADPQEHHRQRVFPIDSDTLKCSGNISGVAAQSPKREGRLSSA